MYLRILNEQLHTPDEYVVIDEEFLYNFFINLDLDILDEAKARSSFGKKLKDWQKKAASTRDYRLAKFIEHARKAATRFADSAYAKQAKTDIPAAERKTKAEFIQQYFDDHKSYQKALLQLQGKKDFKEAGLIGTILYGLNPVTSKGKAEDTKASWNFGKVHEYTDEEKKAGAEKLKAENREFQKKKKEAERKAKAEKESGKKPEKEEKRPGIIERTKNLIDDMRDIKKNRRELHMSRSIGDADKDLATALAAIKKERDLYDQDLELYRKNNILGSQLDYAGREVRNAEAKQQLHDDQRKAEYDAINARAKERKGFLNRMVGSVRDAAARKYVGVSHALERKNDEIAIQNAKEHVAHLKDVASREDPRGDQYSIYNTLQHTHMNRLNNASNNVNMMRDYQ